MDQAVLTDREAPTLGDYRELSRSAILALALGVASVLALAHPIAWILPLGGLVAGLSALRATGRRPELAGRTLAAVGIVLSVLFLAWAPTRAVTRQAALAREARPLGLAFLEVVRSGRLREAHQLTQPHDQRVSPGASLEEHYEPRPEAGFMSPHETLETFLDAEPLRSIRAGGPAARFAFVEETEVRADGGSDVVVQRVEMTAPNRTDPLRFRLTLRRNVDPVTGAGEWHVEGLLADE